MTKARCWTSWRSAGATRPRPQADAQAAPEQGFAPAAVTTDKLRSYGAAFVEIGLTARHVPGLRENDAPRSRTSRCDGENGRCSGSSRIARLAQSFISVHSAAYNTFNVRRHLISRCKLRTFRAEAMPQWHAAAAAG
jgi:hypothetical protein